MSVSYKVNNLLYLLESIRFLTKGSDAAVINTTLPNAILNIRKLSSKIDSYDKMDFEYIFFVNYIEQMSVAASVISNDMLKMYAVKKDTLNVIDQNALNVEFFYESLTFIASLDISENKDVLSDLTSDMVYSCLRSMSNYQSYIINGKFDDGKVNNYLDAQCEKHMDRLNAAISEKSKEFQSFKISAMKFDDEYKSRLVILDEKAGVTNKKADELVKKAEALFTASKNTHSKINREAMAAAFNNMAAGLKMPIISWAVIFVISLAVISILGGVFYYQQVGLSIEVLLSRVFVITPIVWLAWFSGRQYGHAYKMRQDYLYKDAVAKAYHGYKAETGDGHGEMHMHLLKNIVEHFSDNPVRLYDKSEPAMPIEEFIKKISPEHIVDIWKTSQNKGGKVDESSKGIKDQ